MCIVYVVHSSVLSLGPMQVERMDGVLGMRLCTCTCSGVITFVRDHSLVDAVLGIWPV